MGKEWILNSAMNRFQLNFKRNVGAVSEAIRNCSPRSLQEWEGYYFSHIKTKDHINELGKKLYVKISEVIVAEVDEITEQDCIDYMMNMVIGKTYDGYQTEIQTVYGQLQSDLGIKIEPAPDELDRLYNVDFLIKINDSYIGLQIKPASDASHIPQIYKERKLQADTHTKFTAEFGGKVFYVFSVKEGNRKIIIDRKDIVAQIEAEISRLKQ